MQRSRSVFLAHVLFGKYFVNKNTEHYNKSVDFMSHNSGRSLDPTNKISNQIFGWVYYMLNLQHQFFIYTL